MSHRRVWHTASLTSKLRGTRLFFRYLALIPILVRTNFPLAFIRNVCLSFKSIVHERIIIFKFYLLFWRYFIVSIILSTVVIKWHFPGKYSVPCIHPTPSASTGRMPTVGSGPHIYRPVADHHLRAHLYAGKFETIIVHFSYFSVIYEIW